MSFLISLGLVITPLVIPMMTKVDPSYHSVHVLLGSIAVCACFSSLVLMMRQSRVPLEEQSDQNEAEPSTPIPYESSSLLDHHWPSSNAPFSLPNSNQSGSTKSWSEDLFNPKSSSHSVDTSDYEGYEGESEDCHRDDVCWSYS